MQIAEAACRVGFVPLGCADLFLLLCAHFYVRLFWLLSGPELRVLLQLDFPKPHEVKSLPALPRFMRNVYLDANLDAL